MRWYRLRPLLRPVCWIRGHRFARFLIFTSEWIRYPCTRCRVWLPPKE